MLITSLIVFFLCHCHVWWLCKQTGSDQSAPPIQSYLDNWQ